MAELPPPVTTADSSEGTPGSGYERELERAMASGDEDALRDVVEKINAAVHEAAGSPTSPKSPSADHDDGDEDHQLGGMIPAGGMSTPPPAAGLALSTPSLAGMESPPGVAMAVR